MSEKELVLVSCSGGLDSSVTLCVLQLAGYKNIIAVHFKYGARSQLAEEIAIKNITKKLNISLKIFDLEPIYNEIGVQEISMLANKNSEIITGTAKGLKSTAAWHPARNLLFMNMMITLGEAEIMKHNYEKVYLCGGFLQLTESATYCDNTPYFADACLRAAQYGTLIGNRFKPLYCLSNLMKFEQFILIKEFELEDVYKYTISCDRAQVVNGVPCNCMKDNIPACGSGALSRWAASMVGMNDMELRSFYTVDDPGYEAYVPKHLSQNLKKNPDIYDIIDRILLPEAERNYLRYLIDEKEQLRRDELVRDT